MESGIVELRDDEPTVPPYIGVMTLSHRLLLDNLTFS